MKSGRFAPRKVLALHADDAVALALHAGDAHGNFGHAGNAEENGVISIFGKIDQIVILLKIGSSPGRGAALQAQGNLGVRCAKIRTAAGSPYRPPAAACSAVWGVGKKRRIPAYTKVPEETASAPERVYATGMIPAWQREALCSFKSRSPY